MIFRCPWVFLLTSIFLIFIKILFISMTEASDVPLNFVLGPELEQRCWTACP